jgi:hypothetical protein
MASAQDLLLDQRVLLNEVLLTLRTLELEHQKLSAAVDAINGPLNIIAGVQSIKDIASSQDGDVKTRYNPGPTSQQSHHQEISNLDMVIPASPSLLVADDRTDDTQPSAPNISTARRSLSTSRIILTTYPGQSGVDPLTMNWGHEDPAQRGPVVVSRSQSTIRRRNGRPRKSPFSHECHG